jgi:hypothetical protein
MDRQVISFLAMTVHFDHCEGNEAIQHQNIIKLYFRY